MKFSATEAPTSPLRSPQRVYECDVCDMYLLPQTMPTDYWMLTNVDISAMMRKDFTSSDEINAKKYASHVYIP
jgi:hypothetical protein